jgi:hypothetical protein
VQISYLLTRTNAEQLPAVVKAAARAGADELFVTHLDCTPSFELLRAAAFTAGRLREGVAEAVKAAEVAARRSHIAFRGPALQSEEVLVCALNPLRFAFLGWHGRVGPCVNLLLPIAGPIPRWTAGGSTAVAQVCYGHLSDGSLGDLLRGPRYRALTAPLAARLAAERRFFDRLGDASGAEALRRLEASDQQRSQDLASNPLPTECSGCHKAMGW